MCGPAYATVPGLSSRYRTGAAATSWLAAELDCESDGGHLAVPELQAELSYLDQRALASSSEFVWIGLSDHVTEGTFVSVLGTTLTPRWKAGEPNDSAGHEDCTEVSGSDAWNDAKCSDPYDYVCECSLVPLAQPTTYCDTNTTSSCGECGTPCTSGVCVNQTCGGGGG